MNFQVMQKQLRSAKLTRNMLMVVAGVMLAANGADLHLWRSPWVRDLFLPTAFRP